MEREFPQIKVKKLEATYLLWMDWRGLGIAPGAIGPYSQAYKVNGVVYISGQIPVNPETGETPEGIAAQTGQSCKNAGAILEAASR